MREVWGSTGCWLPASPASAPSSSPRTSPSATTCTTSSTRTTSTASGPRPALWAMHRHRASRSSTGLARKWRTASAANIVVTNIHQLVSSSKLWLYRFDPDAFDLVIFDEGHHTAALSWQKVINGFPSARFVSLTATPFRNDGERLLGTTIYTYSFSRAMLHGYIARIKSTDAVPPRSPSPTATTTSPRPTPPLLPWPRRAGRSRRTPQRAPA